MDAREEQRENYPHVKRIPTRWRDNDVYRHINNVVYYEYFDTVINGYLIEAGGLDISQSPAVGFSVETRCQFLKPIRFPQVMDVGLRVAALGNSSVRYEIGIFIAGDDEPAAVGYFVHVFVDRKTLKPTRITGDLRRAMNALMVNARPDTP